MILIQQPSSFSKVQKKCLQNFEYEKVVSEMTIKSISSINTFSLIYADKEKNLWIPMNTTVC